MGKLTGKVAVVTGASKGIGAGIAAALAADGASVVVNYSTSREGAERVVGEITSKGGRAIAVQGNVSIPSDIPRIFDETKKAFGTLDILVNNAGVYEFLLLEAVTPEHFHRLFDINVLGTILAIKEAVKLFPSSGGSVINIGSVSSIAASPSSVVYASTKAAVNAITQVLANELGPRGIRVNAVNPGPVITEGFNSAGIPGSDFEKIMISKTPLGRIGQPDDVAKVATFLASDDSAWLTGETIYVSGGLKS